MASIIPVPIAGVVDLAAVPDFRREFEDERLPYERYTTARAATRPEEVLRIARLDADRVYRDLSRFVIRMTCEADGWHVDFDLKDTAARGDGPHYIIDVESGTIIAKRYEQ